MVRVLQLDQHAVCVAWAACFRAFPESVNLSKRVLPSGTMTGVESTEVAQIWQWSLPGAPVMPVLNVSSRDLA